MRDERNAAATEQVVAYIKRRAGRHGDEMTDLGIAA
jgi:hypothetical protein